MNRQHTVMGTRTLHQPSGPDVLDLGTVDDRSEIIVMTRNSLYRILVINGSRGEAMVWDGEFFPLATRAFLFGGAPCGGVRKLGVLQSGFPLEVVSRDQTVRTGRIRSIEVWWPPPLATARSDHNAYERAQVA